MPLLSPEEKMLLEEALQVYLQLISRQMPPAQVQQIAAIAKNVLKKLDSAKGGSGGKDSDRPAGISDEWFKHVCQECDKLSPSGCTDKVTEKYPGKCDPILHYERDKILKNKK